MTLDATVAGAAADSYLTVAAANALAAKDSALVAEKWLAPLTTIAQKEMALQSATREIDDYTRTAYAPYAVTQKLRFPRADVDVVSAAPVIPDGIANATYYLAAFLLASTTTIARRDGRRARGLKTYGETGTSGTEDESDKPDWPDRVMRALSGFRVSGGAGARTMRFTRLSGGFSGATG